MLHAALPPAAVAGLVPLGTLFSLAGAVAVAGWLALIAFPRGPLVTDRLVGLAVPALLGVLYAGLILAFWAGSPGGFGSLEAAAALLSVRDLLLAGWVHYLAFDLFAGAWEVRAARAEALERDPRLDYRCRRQALPQGSWHGGEARLPRPRLMENRSGLLVDACLTKVCGHAERVAALAMIEPPADRPRPITLGADRATTRPTSSTSCAR